MTVLNFTRVCAPRKQKVNKCSHVCVWGSGPLQRPSLPYTTWIRLMMPPVHLGPGPTAQTPIDQSGQMPAILTSLQPGFSSPLAPELGLSLRTGTRNYASSWPRGWTTPTPSCQLHLSLPPLPASMWLSFSPLTGICPSQRSFLSTFTLAIICYENQKNISCWHRWLMVHKE